MQSQVSAEQIGANALASPTSTPQLDGPLAERQMAELHQACLEHQVNPLGQSEKSRVPYSALND